MMGPMDETSFWKIVDASKQKAPKDRERQIDALVDLLARLEPTEIVDFDRVYRDLLARAYTWDLWGAAYLIGDGCSDDGFDYFRDWLISMGRAAYEAALHDPEDLADLVTPGDMAAGCEFEDFRYAVLQAWEHRTGEDSQDFPTTEATPQASEPAGEPWEEDADELTARYPRLSARL